MSSAASWRRPAASISGRVVRLVAGLDAALVEIGDARPGLSAAAGRRSTRAPASSCRSAARHSGTRAPRLTTRLDEAEAARYAEAAARLDPPAQLAPPPGFAAALALRLPAMPDRVLTDDPGAVPELRGAFAGAEVAQRRVDEWPLDLGAAFDGALAPSLALPGGGSVHFEDTRAAVLVDVDTGSPETGSAERTAMAVNLAAAAAIARQLRLRQLAGGILVDFAALEGRGPRDRVRQAMTLALAADPARPQILGWSRLGHLEIVRPRRLRPLAEAMLEPQAARKSAAALAFEALRALSREARARPAADWRLVVVPAVETALRGPAAAGLREPRRAARPQYRGRGRAGPRDAF